MGSKQLELIPILQEPRERWFHSEKEVVQQEAISVLIEFKIKLENISPDKNYRDCGSGVHTFYIFYLLELRNFLIEKEYIQACDHLLDMIFRTPITQSRIMYNIIELLESYLIDEVE